MDNQNSYQNTQSKFQKILTKRNIFILLGVLVAAEIIWASWTLIGSQKVSSQTVSKTIATTESEVSAPANPVTLSLETSQKQLKVGDKFTVSINTSVNKLTDGIDLIILYNPKLISVQNAKEPVVVGSLYNEYPVNKADETSGKITISGIVSKKGGIKANGLFGTIDFQAKAKGVTKVSFDFTPGSTVDTNVIETSSGKDILEKVNNLEVNIQ